MSVDDYGGIFTMQKLFKDGKIISIAICNGEAEAQMGFCSHES